METQDNLSALDAWAHFWENERPLIWKKLTHKERNRLINAQRDAEGKRKDRYGKPCNLGPKRIGDILAEYAPGKYQVETKTFVSMGEVLNGYREHMDKLQGKNGWGP